MKPKKLLIVTQKFWPHAGLTEIGLGELAINLSQAGHDVIVATVQWSRDWSECISYHGIPVVRFARPVAGPWSSFRYARSLAKHFSITTYDGIIVAGMSDEASAVFKTCDEETPVLLHVDNDHFDPDSKLTSKQIENLAAAASVVTISPALAQHLSEYCPDGIDIVEPGIRQIDREPDESQSIRKALSKAHQVLTCEPDQPLVVSCTRMDRHGQLSDLLSAWPVVLKEHPKARLWLVGEGKVSSALWQQILDLDLTYSVVLPGYFDQITDVFAAADLYVHCASEKQNPDGLIRAMVCSTATVASQNKITNQLISDGQNGLLFEPGNLESLAAALLKGISDHNWRQRAGECSRNRLAERYLPIIQVNRYIGLVNSLTDYLVETAQ
jgi:glycosyltransferase involved in cell wall biosynthesis